MNIRPVNASEYAEMLRMISRCFEYPEYEQIDRDFPQLFASDNHAHLYVAEEGKIQGHAGAWLTRLRVENQVWSVGGVGAVCTIPEARGSGVATNLVKAVCEDLKKRGAILAFLWSGQHEFYRKLGFETVGRQWSIAIPHDGPKVISKEWEFKSEKSEEFFSFSLSLLKKQNFGVERDIVLHRLLLSSKACSVYSAWKGNELVAYAVVNKGRDLGDHIHEWAGDSRALPPLIHWLAQKIGRPHVLLAPQMSEAEAPFIYELDRQGYRIDAGVMGLAKVLAPGVLAEQINQIMKGHLQLRVKFGAPKVAPTYICETGGQEFNLNESQMLSFFFGAGGDKVNGLPLRLWWWGMESV